ncbi:MAG: glycosyltransferase family 2 protein [Rhodanobacteraceae bacterium]
MQSGSATTGDGPVTFTVLTPTFNRAHTLERAYRSLCRQSCRDFEWLVVDDGSTDATRAPIERLQQVAPFPIRYLWQPNRHKKVAFNNGILHASGEWIVAIDSDDELEPDALKGMAAIWAGIPATDRERYVGITGLCVRPNGQVVGDRFPRDVMDATTLDIHFRHHVHGEKFGSLRTAVLRQFPFREDVAGFVSENTVWSAMARAGYLTCWVNQVFRVYHDSPDALVHRGVNQSNATGLWLAAFEKVGNNIAWFRYQPLSFLAAAARYTRFGLHMRRFASPRPQGMRLERALSRSLAIVMVPFWRRALPARPPGCAAAPEPSGLTRPIHAIAGRLAD